jgi:hypothetical protein
MLLLLLPLVLLLMLLPLKKTNLMKRWIVTAPQALRCQSRDQL